MNNPKMKLRKQLIAFIRASKKEKKTLGINLSRDKELLH